MIVDSIISYDMSGIDQIEAIIKGVTITQIKNFEMALPMESLE